MQVCSVVRGNTAASASLMPLRPSVTAMRMSWQPRTLRSREDLHPEFRPLGLLDPDAQDVPGPVRQDREREIHRLAPDGRLLANLDAQGIEEDHRIHRLERPLLPRRGLRDDRIGDRLIRSGDTSTAYISRGTPGSHARSSHGRTRPGSCRRNRRSDARASGSAAVRTCPRGRGARRSRSDPSSVITVLRARPIAMIRRRPSGLAPPGG